MFLVCMLKHSVNAFCKKKILFIVNNSTCAVIAFPKHSQFKVSYVNFL